MFNRFGTTAEMVIETISENGKEVVLAIDAKGLYMTTPAYVGRPLADRNRYGGDRADVPGRLAALGLDAKALAARHQHLVRVETVATKKVNPLKASKRGAKG